MKIHINLLFTSGLNFFFFPFKESTYPVLESSPWIQMSLTTSMKIWWSVCQFVKSKISRPSQCFTCTVSFSRIFLKIYFINYQIISDQISRSVVSDSLRPHESQHARIHLHLQIIWIINSAVLESRFYIFNSFQQADNSIDNELGIQKYSLIVTIYMCICLSIHLYVYLSIWFE